MTININKGLDPTQARLSVKLARLGYELNKQSFFSETYNLALRQLIEDQEGFMHSLVYEFNTNKTIGQDWSAFVVYCQNILTRLGLTRAESNYLIRKYTEE